MRHKHTARDLRPLTSPLAQIGLPDSPFLTMAEAARYGRWDDCANPARAFRAWLRRHAIAPIRRGGKLLIERAVLEAVLRRP